ncbi:Nudix family hydrolase [Paenalcaligenes sp.]|uniref:Nudix family hydrolase n=1 Tax=Paenalcaligenes sp. TaxID=1966342 RepID=UPI002623E254|nr:Nudix family hydrolase [Paenalcaligenes sp.]
MTTKTHPPYVRVAVGVILDPMGHVLLGSRPADKPWPHWWELPGGKIETNESVPQALIRELHEEIGIHATTLLPWIRYIHHYPRSTVELNFYQVTEWQGTPTPQENQQLAWCHPDQPIPLTIGPILPATFPILRWLRLPKHYLLSNIGQKSGVSIWLEKLHQALQQGVRLVQFREPAWENNHPNDPDCLAALQQTVDLCHQWGALCLLNSIHPWDWVGYADGLHLRSHDAARLAQNQHAAPINKRQLLAVSAHHAQDIKHAQQLNSDFVVIGHVLDTPSHPNQPALGWERFYELAQQAGRPAFAIGGQSPTTFKQAQTFGAHGIAGIRQLITD